MIENYSITSSLSLEHKTSVFETSVDEVSTVTYFLNCKKLLLGIDSIELLILFVIFSEDTTITNLSTRFIILFIII